MIAPRFEAPDEGTLVALRRDLTAWFQREQRDLPWRRTRDPYAIWVSEAMLQQTRVETVLDYWPRFLERFPTIRALAEASEDAVLEAWSGLGYYRRARSLQAAARVITDRHGAEFPRDLDDALALPGIGPYTAGAVLSIAYDLPVPIVDGNVERVFSRWFLMDGVRTSGPLLREAWKAARAMVVERPASEAAPREWNQALMELGALVCKPTSPACGACPVSEHCRARAAGVAADLPRARPKKAPIEVTLEIYAARRDGAWLLERRGPDGLMGGMWQFPTVEVEGPGLFPDHLASEIEPALEASHDLFSISHGITKHRIKGRVRAATCSESKMGHGPDVGWFPDEAAEGLALTGMAKKVLARLRRDASQTDLFGGESGR
ncbi:A/G-specific adenine glycosylase [Saltatorellus ferox]|uniref:A/G-specific adenine glycosylase n=1 Tax=Saltatorellus ferox TaxID=2528018 RepID=UPI003AF3C3B9